MTAPPMPAWFAPKGWDGKPVDDAARHWYWLRHCGYSGPISVDGTALEN